MRTAIKNMTFRTYAEVLSIENLARTAIFVSEKVNQVNAEILNQSLTTSTETLQSLLKGMRILDDYKNMNMAEIQSVTPVHRVSRPSNISDVFDALQSAHAEISAKLSSLHNLALDSNIDPTFTTSINALRIKNSNMVVAISSNQRKPTILV